MSLVEVFDVIGRDDLDTFRKVYDRIAAECDGEELQKVAFEWEAYKILEFLIGTHGKFLANESMETHSYRNVDIFRLALRYNTNNSKVFRRLLVWTNTNYAFYKCHRDLGLGPLYPSPNLSRMCMNLISSAEPELFREFVEEFRDVLLNEMGPASWGCFEPHSIPMAHLIIQTFGDLFRAQDKSVRNEGLFSWSCICSCFTSEMFHDKEIQEYMPVSKPSAHYLQLSLRSKWHGLYEAILEWCFSRGQSLKELKRSRSNASHAIYAGNSELADQMWPANPPLALIREAMEYGMVELVKKHVGVGPDIQGGTLRIDPVKGHKLTSGITLREGLEAILRLGLRSCVPKAAELEYATLAGREGLLEWFASQRVSLRERSWIYVDKTDE